MHFHFSFYSSFLLLFFLQALLFAALLLRKGKAEGQPAYYWLAAFLVAGCLYIAPWMLGHAGWYSQQPYRDLLFYLPLQHRFLIGPLLYGYTRCLLNPEAAFRRRDLLHFLPAALYIGYSCVMFVTDKLVLGRPWFYADGHDRDLDTWYAVAGMVSMGGYLWAAYRYYRVYRRLLLESVSDAGNAVFSWIRKYLLAFGAVQAIGLAVFLIWPGWGGFTFKWWSFLAFAVLLYYIGLNALMSRERTVLRFAAEGEGYRVVPLHGNGTEEPGFLLPATDPEPEPPDPELLAWKGRLLDLMVSAAPYRDPELNLGALARLLGTNTATLSRTINRGFGVNFNDFVNHYRVRAVLEALAAGEQEQQTLLGIAFDSGFNSKNTFNRAFRKHTGHAPSEYNAVRPGSMRVLSLEKVGSDHKSGRPEGSGGAILP
ncbi:helix-turn-helix domain-containing protein [Flaviaesturariibacter amylovorans]|uniref:HTH araC/xylS-type domain-containing protein n=1 Tax=Flaviaesturariibacter amylovorans TaxID=1084520 RepID=A0ABP8GJY8_9BACT